MVTYCRAAFLGFLVLALIGCLAPAALAGTVTARLNDPPSDNTMDGIYVGPYSAINTQTGGAMTVTCDDFADTSNYSTSSYTINTLSSLGSTLWGAQLLKAGDTMSQITALYEQAAWLDLGMMQVSGTTQAYYSFALWAVFDATDVLNWLKGYHDFAACNAVFGAGNNCNSTTITQGGLLASAQQNYASGNYSNLLILTPIGCGPTGCPEQEFLEFVQVPEGGTALLYLGLTGLVMGAALRYTRRRAAAAA